MLCELRKLFQITGNAKNFLLLLLLRCPFDALRTILLAGFISSAFKAIEMNSMEHLNVSCLMFGIGNIILFMYNGTIWMNYAAFSIRIIRLIRYKLFRHIGGISLKQMEDTPSGDWMTRLNSDVLQATAILSQPLHLPHAATAVISILCSSIILFLLDPLLFTVVIMFIIPHLLISQIVIAKPARILAKKAQELTSINTTDCNTLLTCAETALLYDAKDFLLGRFKKTSLDLRSANMQMRKRSALGDALLPIMGMSGYLTALLIGGTLIGKGQLKFSELTAIYQYRGGILMGAMMLANCFISIKASLAGIQRITETMEIESEENKIT